MLEPGWCRRVDGQKSKERRDAAVSAFRSAGFECEVPLATMFGYVTDLRSMTQGRATSSLHFSHYAPVPAAVQEQVVAKVKGT